MADGAREQILDAAFRLFVRDGYDATSIDRILAELPFTKGALYYHFAGKQALLDAVLERFLTDSLNASDRDAVDDPVEHAHRMVDDYIAGIDRIAAHATPIAYFSFLTAIAPRVTDSLRAAHTAAVEGLAATLPAALGADRRPIAADVVALIEGTVMLTVLRDEPIDVPALKQSVERALKVAAEV